MKDAHKELIVQAIRTEMTEKNLSQNQWADMHGLGRSSMTNILNKKNWSKVGDRTWTALYGKIQHILSTPKLYPTTNSQEIIRACEDAQQNNRVVSVVGYTGAGKTTTLKQYASTHPNAYYLVCRSTFGVKDLVIQMAAVMGIQAKGGRTIDIEQAVIDELTNTSKSLLIIDSVSKLRKEAALQFLGDLCEATEQKAGIILAGTEFFDEHMNKMVMRNKRGFREFNRRIYSWLKLPSFKSASIQAEARAICNNHGIFNQKQIDIVLKGATCFGSLSNSIHRMLKATSN